MQLHPVDYLLFVGFIGAVVAFAMWCSRRERSSEDYFLASRSLTWPFIGLSIVAANISTEQMVGMAGQGAGSVGLAVSAWQLAGSVGIVIIAFTLLPRFLRAGIYTMPEFLEYRYNVAARTIMAGLTAIIYVAVLLTAVLYSGGLSLHTIFGFDLTTSVWIVGAVAALYTTWGGLKAVAYADLLLGSGLLVGGMSIFAIGLNEHGGWSSFAARNAARLHMILPAEHPELPWTGVVGGMWIVILYYCGLNQFIVQRNLAARTLHDGQMGMVFAGGLWLLVPFAIVMPGIMAFSLYNSELAEIADKNNAKVLAQLEAFQASPDEHPPLIVEPDADWIARFPEQGRRIEAFNRAIQDRAQIGDVEPIRKRIAGYQSDAAFPTLVKNLIPVGMRGLIFAAIAGAVISSLASMLNSASTIVTMDLYKRLFAPRLEERRLVAVGRLLTLVFVVIACLMAPQLADPRFKGVFNFIQQFQGYIWPGVTAAFVMAFALPRAPGGAGVAALVAGPLFYGFFQFVWPLIPGVPQFHFLLQVLFTFLLVCAIMIGITLVAPLHEPRTLPERADMHAPNSRLAMALGAAVILGVFTIVVLFSW